jgi:thiamine phosphate synthase YjbQ (UPF0047 family)
MSSIPNPFTLSLRPRSRVDVIDVTARLEEESPGFSRRFQKAAYCSHHTTAGYLEQSLLTRLNHCPESVRDYVSAFRRLFPEGAGYRHDELDLREELSAAQRAVEPRNGDSHLTFIGSGLLNCVAYRHRPRNPIYFIDLDGVNGEIRRERRTTVLGYNEEETVEKLQITVPVSKHAVDSINIRDPRLGLFEELGQRLSHHGIERGRIDLSLAPGERHAGITVNEYETLLMKHDLAEVLSNPLRFMAEKGRNMMIDPLAIPGKTINYAKYDFVQVLNRVMDTFGISNSPLERIVDKFLAVPAARFLRMKRSVNLLVSEEVRGGEGRILQGRYQSPILVQWDRAPDGCRRLEATLSRFL